MEACANSKPKAGGSPQQKRVKRPASAKAGTRSKPSTGAKASKRKGATGKAQKKGLQKKPAKKTKQNGKAKKAKQSAKQYYKYRFISSSSSS